MASGARQRQSVERSPSSDSKITYTEFLRRFPDSDACLEFLKERHYPDGTSCPKCEKPSRFRKIKGRSAYSCQWCGHHVYPTAGTIFHKTTTSLQVWFWAIYLLASSKCGISAKQLGREIGVSYKTSHRMLKMIRTLLGYDGDHLSGEVELDETFYGGKPRASDTRGMSKSEVARYSLRKKTIVFAAGERGGRVRASVVPRRDKANLIEKTREFVLPESMIFTDEWPPYEQVAPFFRGHKRVKHKQRIYVQDDAGTQNLESFFALFKNSVRGAHHNVSTKYLQAYLDEYTFRWNHRHDERPIFWTILDRVEKEVAPAVP
jgi:transposase